MDEWIVKIAQQARALGVRPGETLLVHSSLKSLGIPGLAPFDVIRGLQAAAGETGTLLFPTLSYEFCNAEHPYFNVKTTPACTGAIAEASRSFPGAVRSLHPTHSCTAIGPLARELTARHAEDATPGGPHSPFALLPGIDGSVLFLGCGCRCNTSMHAVEELFCPPYLFAGEVSYTVTDAAGNEHTVVSLRHNFLGVAQRYDRVADRMPEGCMRGKILNANCVLLRAAPMWETAEEMLSRDPFALVEREG